LGSGRLGDELLFKSQKGLQAAGLVGILPQSHLLKLQLFDLFPKLAVLLPNASEIEVVAPDIGRSGLQANDAFFKGVTAVTAQTRISREESFSVERLIWTAKPKV